MSAYQYAKDKNCVPLSNQLLQPSNVIMLTVVASTFFSVCVNVTTRVSGLLAKN